MRAKPPAGRGVLSSTTWGTDLARIVALMLEAKARSTIGRDFENILTIRFCVEI
jgi:hypothetical protein